MPDEDPASGLSATAMITTNIICWSNVTADGSSFETADPRTGVSGSSKTVLGAAANPEILERETPNFHKLAWIVDTRLAQSKWLCGDSPTIADIVVASAIHLHQWQKLPLSQHKNLSRWMTDNVEQLPCWKNTMVYEGFMHQKQAA